MSNFPYFCQKCHKQVEAKELLFVSESDGRGFCSHACIMSFYNPYIEFFSNLEIKIRESLDLDVEPSYMHLYADNSLMEQVLKDPNIKKTGADQLGQVYHFHHKYLDNGLHYFIVASYYQSEASFIYFKLITSSQKLIEKMMSTFSLSDESEGQIGEDSSLEKITLDDELMSDINRKKSALLAQLLTQRKDDDIAFEHFTQYDHCIEVTLEDPDQIFESEDDEGDPTQIYVKSFKNKKTYFYIVICSMIELEQRKQKAAVPILCFPSVDNDIYQHYCSGKSKITRVKN